MIKSYDTHVTVKRSIQSKFFPNMNHSSKPLILSLIYEGHAMHAWPLNPNPNPKTHTFPVSTHAEAPLITIPSL